jgi:hypothetical protein
MDNYLKKIGNLKSGERSMSVSRSASPQPDIRRNSVEKTEDLKQSSSQSMPVKKVVLKEDFNNLVSTVENIKNQLLVFVEESNKRNEELNVNFSSLRKEVLVNDQQSKTERLKEKLDNFINKYNDNEIAHSDHIRAVEKEIYTLDSRVKSLEEMF